MPAATVAMVLLSCSAGMLLCRPVENQPAIYANMTECESALQHRLAGPAIIGKCQPLRDPGSTVDWKITADGELLTFEAPRARSPAPTDTDRSTTASVSPTPKPEFATVRVTRMTGTGAITKDYAVPRQ